MKEFFEKINKNVKFLIEFSFKNAIWILPIVYFYLTTVFIKVLFISFLIYYLYSSWVNYNKTKIPTLQKTPKRIHYLYYVSISIFFILTTLATYEGIITTFRLNKYIAIIFACGISLTLFVITLLIKNRRKPSFILSAMVLYILFDALIALPFNFLFFYNKLTDSYKIEEDKKNIPIVIQKVDSILKPKISNTAISLQINDAELKQNLNIIDLQTEEKLKDLEKIYSLNSKEYNLERSKILNIKKQQKNNVFIAPKTKKDITNLAQNSVKNKVYETLKLKLDTCSILNRKLILSDNNDSNKLITDIIKNKLVNICNSDPDLKSFVKILNTQHPSSLKSLELLYKFIGKKLTTTTTNNNNEAVAEVANLNFNSDTERLITMSLSISIVIDILPLLLSLLYRKYNIDD